MLFVEIIATSAVDLHMNIALTPSYDGAISNVMYNYIPAAIFWSLLSTFGALRRGTPLTDSRSAYQSRCTLHALSADVLASRKWDAV